MNQFYITPRAARDIDGIARWNLNRWGSTQMETYMRGLHDRFVWLAKNPMPGRARDNVAKKAIGALSKASTWCFMSFEAIPLRLSAFRIRPWMLGVILHEVATAG